MAVRVGLRSMNRVRLLIWLIAQDTVSTLEAVVSLQQILHSDYSDVRVLFAPRYQ